MESTAPCGGTGVASPSLPSSTRIRRADVASSISWSSSSSSSQKRCVDSRGCDIPCDIASGSRRSRAAGNGAPPGRQTADGAGNLGAAERVGKSLTVKQLTGDVSRLPMPRAVLA